MVRVAINGFGRIGRNAFRVNLEREMLDIVAINDPGGARTAAHLLKYDSVYGTCPSTIETVSEDMLKVDGKDVAFFAQRDPKLLPWKDLDIDVVIEATGVFTDMEGASQHLSAGAKKVVLSAPGKGVDCTMVMGVNQHTYDAVKHRVVSNASCTTNCLAPVAKALNDTFGIEKGLMTTIHAYTNDQRIMDLAHSDLRRARAAALSVIPTSTGAAKAIGQVLPELDGKLHGLSMRVPVPTVSTVDLVCVLKRKVTKDEINQTLREAASGDLSGILVVSDQPLVSSDYKKHPASSIVDSELTMVMGDNLVKVIAWYDNEWGYSCRLVEVTELVGS